MKKNIYKNRIVIIFSIIFLIGIFFRAYHHEEFLRFNPDQARDAALARDVIDNDSAWPLLGPKAGGTEFRLGPIFYDFEIIAGKIFGSSPDKLAFPDLFFSILSIPLLYFFLRKFFDQKISLTSTLIFAVSFYAIKYARFAWNPNSTPFFVLLFLYALAEFSRREKRRKWLWACLSGVAAGVGVQLHSLLLFSLPIVFVIYFVYLFFKKNPAWKWAPLILFLGILVNTPQLVSEIETGGKNTQAFFQGMQKKSSRSGTLAQKLILDATCHIQADAFMLLPLGSDSECDFLSATNNVQKNTSWENLILLGDIIFAIVFSVGGYFLLFKFYREEKDAERKNVFALVAIFTTVLFLILIPLADEISFRFFLVAEFAPFLFLGLWLNFISEYLSKNKVKINPISVGAIIVAIIVATNVGYVARNFSSLAGRAPEGQNGFEEITLGEVESMANFIETHSTKTGKIYIDGKAGELFKIRKPIQFFTDAAGLKVNQLSKKDILTQNDQVFLIDVMNDPTKGGGLSQKNKNKYDILDEARFQRVKIYELKRK